MTTASQLSHNESIVTQFTRQAIPFSQLHSIEESMQLLTDASGVGKGDTVLDVACGPGIVACAFARLARHVTGIDLTPAMLDAAARLQESKSLENLTWKLGDVMNLPFDAGTFSIVVSRYAFHHFTDPAAVLMEMVRVCRPGGRIVVADVFTTNDAQELAYNQMEKLRDPSHVRALGLEELKGIFQNGGIADIRTDFYRFPIELDHLLQATCTPAVEADAVRKMVADDIGKDIMGVSASRDQAGLRFSFPIVIVSGQKLG